jgi:hypothetical protein
MSTEPRDDVASPLFLAQLFSSNPMEYESQLFLGPADGIHRGVLQSLWFWDCKLALIMGRPLPEQLLTGRSLGHLDPEH